MLSGVPWVWWVLLTGTRPVPSWRTEWEFCWTHQRWCKRLNFDVQHFSFGEIIINLYATIFNGVSGCWFLNNSASCPLSEILFSTAGDYTHWQPQHSSILTTDFFRFSTATGLSVEAHQNQCLDLEVTSLGNNLDPCFETTCISLKCQNLCLSATNSGVHATLRRGTDTRTELVLRLPQMDSEGIWVWMVSVILKPRIILSWGNRVL